MPESKSCGNDALRAEIHEFPSDNRISLTATAPLSTSICKAVVHIASPTRYSHKTSDVCTVSDVRCCLHVPHAIHITGRRIELRENRRMTRYKRRARRFHMY
ncbi:hypothetical protein ACS0PU_013056 [Formica fusca]